MIFYSCKGVRVAMAYELGVASAEYAIDNPRPLLCLEVRRLWGDSLCNVLYPTCW